MPPFSVQQTWDGKPLAAPAAQVSLSAAGTDLVLDISAPYHGDPAPPGGQPGQSYWQLWEHEVVEAFFLNDAEQYLEVEFGPHGQYIVLLLAGRRNAVKHSLPVDYTASISPDNTTWTGKARFPASYLPPRITHWNAYAIHGTGEAREYSALYGGPGPQPDFHRLENFRPLDLPALLPANAAAELSGLWVAALAEQGKPEPRLTYQLERTWDDQPVNHSPVQVSLSSAGTDLVLDISAPYHGDPAPPGGQPGQSYWQLWEHEVVEAFFLNDAEQYLEVEFGPHGQYIVLLLAGRRNAVKHSLPLEFTASIEGDTWAGTARVPLSYLPPNVTRMNMYAIHGEGEDRVYEALYESRGPQPDFHRLEKFRPVDLSSLLGEEVNTQLSDTWRQALLETETDN